ncbi:MAG: hypothetical protein ACFE7R_03955 [Candidatus Hodarchaeota archaeon]
MSAMEDESKYRVEAPDEKEEKTGLLAPLPPAEKEIIVRDGKREPIVKLLGFSMTEKFRDRLVMFLIPALVAVVDAAIFSNIIVGQLPATGIYTFLIPMLAAIPIGLIVSKTSQSLIAAFIASAFYVLFFILFLISPAILWPAFEIGEFLVTGLVVASVYFFMVVLATLMGTLIGAVAREFF